MGLTASQRIAAARPDAATDPRIVRRYSRKPVGRNGSVRRTWKRVVFVGAALAGSIIVAGAAQGYFEASGHGAGFVDVAQADFGAQGPTGPRGATGPTGPQGVAGTPGAAGAAGPTGARGATGPKGATGAQGAQGVPGTAGTNGTNGTNGVSGWHVVTATTTTDTSSNLHTYTLNRSTCQAAGESACVSPVLTATLACLPGERALSASWSFASTNASVIGSTDATRIYQAPTIDAAGVPHARIDLQANGTGSKTLTFSAVCVVAS